MADGVFGYGDFMKDAVLRKILGRLPKRVPAKLRGYRRFFDDLLGHYNLVHEDGGVVEGELLLGITAKELRALDAFETDTYRRRVITVHTEAGPSEAWVYEGKA